MTILDRTLDTGRIRIDAARFTDELAKRLPDSDQFDISKVRETAGVAVHDAADRARESFDQATELIKELRSDIARAGDRVQADNPLDEVAQRLRAATSTTAIRALVARLERELPDTDRDRYARAFARGRAQGRSRYLVVGIAGGVAAGIVAAALLEPGHGKERRNLIGSRISSLTAGVSTRVASTAKVAQDRAREIAKEELRALCASAAAGGHRHDIGDRLWRFYRWCADADIPELTTLAETIETWWPAIEVFLSTGITNARTEGTNRLIKQVKRAACGFRNRENYRRRVRLHCTRRTRRLSARKPTVPA